MSLLARRKRKTEIYHLDLCKFNSWGVHSISSAANGPGPGSSKLGNFSCSRECSLPVCSGRGLTATPGDTAWQCETTSAGMGLTKPFREIWEWRWDPAVHWSDVLLIQLPPALRVATPTHKWHQPRRHLSELWWAARWHHCRCKPRMRCHEGKGLLEVVARLTQQCLGAWHQSMDMGYPEDSQTQKLEIHDSTNREGLCPSVGWKLYVSFPEKK